MKVYVCARVNELSYMNVSLKVGRLKYLNVEYLRPQLGDVKDRAFVAAHDMSLINQADEMWVFGDFGMDCMWEIGYAVGKGIPVTIFLDDSNRVIAANQWMLYGAPVKLMELP